LNDIFFGVPTQLGRKGVERIFEYELDEGEMAAFQRSAQDITENIAKLEL